LVGFAAGPANAQTADEVRQLLVERVGDLDKLRVPESNNDLPQPRLEDGTLDPRYVITEEKRFLGKLLFHDPVRSNNIDPAFGGDLATGQTASCGSCHHGQAGSKAGQVQSIGVGGEGRLEMDRNGSFVMTRHIADGMVDTIPTPIEVRDDEGNVLVSGRFDQVDAPPRLAPSVVGFAYNNRLLWGGEAGEPFDPDNPAKANSNPDGLPTGENLAQLTARAHRMADTQQFALQQNPIYGKLFAAAFPEEHARFLETGDSSDFINESTVQRAMATFLRTVVTHETPWDEFLAGDNDALTSTELRGAWLFAADVASGGAGCISCHSGPALNKQLGDEDGILVEENFLNLGLGDHPLQELARNALNNPDHHDGGRRDVTARAEDSFQFKTPTLRQVADGRQFMHSGELEGLRAVLDYFNAGAPTSDFAVAAGNVAQEFTNPRGPDVTGLGLSEADLDGLEIFLANGLYDPRFTAYDADSRTDTFDPNSDDLTYSEEFKALGAVDGMLPSQMAVGNDDPVSRDQSLFVRGRVNSDDRVDIADIIFLVNYLFVGGEAPVPMVAADTNHDFAVDLSDGLYLLNFLFQGGPQPPMPFPNPGQLVP